MPELGIELPKPDESGIPDPFVMHQRLFERLRAAPAGLVPDELRIGLGSDDQEFAIDEAIGTAG